MPEHSTDSPLRVFVAGASGAIGQALIPKLVARGYHVAAMTRTPGKAAALSRIGAEPVVCDVFDEQGLVDAVAQARPAVVVNQLTELPDGGLKPRKLGDYYAGNDRVRREGTGNLLRATHAAAARRYVGQSVAFFYEPAGGRIKQEEEALWTNGPAPFGAAAQAIVQSERAVIESRAVEGVILRYGSFYGPGTWYAPKGDIGRRMAKRQYPIIGAGAGMTSFVHVDDAAEVCAAFVEGGRPGVYYVVDDEPAPANDWMPAFAAAIGAKPPRRVPAWFARLVVGRALVEWTTTCRGASNEALKRALDWQPQYPSWRQGFARGLVT